MEVKPGYKQTEVGAIPVDWDVKPLADIADKIMVGIASAATHAYRVTGVPMFRNQNIKAGQLEDTDLLFIAPEYEAKFKNKRLRPGDLLTMRTGYPGVTAIVPPKYDSAQSFTTLITRPNQREAESPYLCHYVNSEMGQQFFTQSQIGGAQKNVNVGTLRKMPLPLPKLPEQRAIAMALSDVDGLVGGLDRLIAKKRDLKQAAMQQLLTGQTRLTGFHGEWEVERLGDVADVKTGPFGSTLHESDYVREGTPIITVEHLGEFGVEHFNLPLVSGSDRQRLRAYSLEIGDIVFSRVGSVDRNALIRPVEAGWLFSGRLLRVRPEKQKVFAPFLSYQFHGETFITEVRNVAVGQTMACLNTQILKGIPISLPSVPEQTAIASVLSEMDGELAVLEQRREKTRALKQAMMQELLTGKRRIV